MHLFFFWPKFFITPILKSLVILVIWLALNSAIYSQIAPFFALNRILSLAHGSKWKWSNKNRRGLSFGFRFDISINLLFSSTFPHFLSSSSWSACRGLNWQVLQCLHSSLRLINARQNEQGRTSSGDSVSSLLKDQHNQRPNNLHEQFTILKKCHEKFECLIYEMLLIRKKRPTLNTQKDSIPVKLFI